MRRRGFSLLELVVVLAIVAIVAAIAVASFEATRRNTSLDGVVQELGGQIQGLRMTALAEQRDHLLVLVSPPGNDASGCGVLAPGSCPRVFVLRNPQAAWTVDTFDPAAPGTNADYVDVTELPRGILLDLAGAGRPAPAPFAAVTTWAADVTAPCAGRTCLAIRFGANGEVEPERVVPPGGGGAMSRTGLAFGLTTDQLGLKGAAQRRGLLVSAPGGITRIFPY